MITLLFWNLHHSLHTAELVVRAAVDHDVDVIVLAEPAQSAAELTRLLSNQMGEKFQHHSGLINERVVTITRGPVACESVIFESAYLAIWPLAIPNRPEILLAAIHGVSRREADLQTLNEEATIAAEQVRATEDRRGHARTVLIGDFNINPFDEGMAKPRGFHGVMTQAIAKEEVKQVKFQNYPMFYNPMWSRMGDCSAGPPGTYYFHRAGHLNYYWHTYDQVLLRPALIKGFRHEDLRVLDRIGRVSLLDQKGKPSRKNASDHLPIVLTLQF